jgi:nitroreductase
VQNILLACRALGLGATLTTVSSLYEDELKPILQLPADVSTYALIPIGYPRGKFGPVQRLPVEEVTCVDRWGTPLKRPA